jgi:hypothetical protein
MNRIKDLAALAIALGIAVTLASESQAGTRSVPKPIPSWEQIQCFKPFTRVVKTNKGTFVVTYDCEGNVLHWIQKINPPVRN